MDKPYRTKFLDYDARRDPKTNVFCVRCQKDIKGEPKLHVHLVDGGPFVLHPEDENKYVDDGGDLLFHPIGSCCAKILGMEWVHKE